MTLKHLDEMLVRNFQKINHQILITKTTPDTNNEYEN